MRILAYVAAATLVALLVGCAKRNNGRAAFVVRLGADTIVVERFTSAGGRTEGDVVERSPTTSLTHYAFATDSAGHVTHLEAEQRPPSAASSQAQPQRVTVDRARDGFDIVMRDGDSTRRMFVRAGAEAIPLFTRALALYEVATARLRRSGADSIVVPILFLGDTEVTPRAIHKVGADSVVIPLIFPRGERARVDTEGRILGVSGLMTSYKWLTERVSDVDIATIAQSFGSRDARGASFGNFSARDTARAVIDSATITIDYGRPSKRGRVIFGGLVPWGEVWRTGADLATHLTTTHDLRLNNLVVPAGTYTLYTLPSPDGWKLIVNRRTGQIGLAYDPSADLGRVDLSTSTQPGITERLTITVLPAPPQSGTLRIEWDNVRAEVPFTVVSGSRTGRRR